MTVFYLFALTPITDALLGLPLAARVPIAIAVMAPLGVCLGAFMPLGLSTVAELTDHRREYVAWAWAVNGFASVVGSVLTTILAMTFGFQVVLVLALLVYTLAAGSLMLLRKPTEPRRPPDGLSTSLYLTWTRHRSSVVGAVRQLAALRPAFGV